MQLLDTIYANVQPSMTCLYQVSLEEIYPIGAINFERITYRGECKGICIVIRLPLEEQEYFRLM